MFIEKKRLPKYLQRGIIDTEKTKTVRKILRSNCLNTVCEAARCPNKGECYTNNTATFLIMGNNCTRNCRFCNINYANPEPLDILEPLKIADAVLKLGLNYVVITSVLVMIWLMVGLIILFVLLIKLKKLIQMLKLKY